MFFINGNILDFNMKTVEYKILCQIRFTTVCRIVYCISRDYCSAQNCSVFTTWRWTMAIVGNFLNRFSFTAFSSDVRHLKLFVEYERCVCFVVYSVIHRL